MNDLSFRRHRMLFALIAAGILLFTGCNDSAPPSVPPQKALPSVSIGGYQVPVFPSPSEQFNYAKSWFCDPGEKKAALGAVARLYPTARRQRGHAALELAYTRLGTDYRMADRTACLETIGEYNDIIEEYEDLPEIRAKAGWYIGWIYCDLIDEKPSGIESYRKVVDRFPSVKVVPAPPVPWVSIVYPDDRQKDRPETGASPYFWAGIALVEIVRHSNDSSNTWNAFETLLRDYPAGLSTGNALKLLLGRPSLAEKAFPFAEDYLAKHNPGLHLTADIRRAMDRYRGKATTREPGEAANGN